MKKLSIFAVGLVALLSATSCSSDDALDAPGNGSEANVSFTLELPKGLASRAFGDGTTATSLSYAVYDVTGASDPSAWTEVYKKDDDGTFVGLKTTKSFKLVNGRTYTFVFWADNGSTSPYTFNGKGVSVDYTDLTNNEEGRDAFFAVKSDIKVTGCFTQDVELYRPFAQLNLGTDDLAEEVVTKVYGENCANLNTKLTVKVPNALNLIDGSVAEQGEWTEVTFGPNGIPTGETFPVEHPEKPTKTYGYLSMNYLLMPATKSVIDVKYEFYNGTSTEAAKTINLTNVPVQRNYRTNIFGSLLTSEGIFNIEIKPDFEKPDNDVEVVVVSDALTFSKVLEEVGGEVQVENDMTGLTSMVDILKPSNIDFAGHTFSNIETTGKYPNGMVHGLIPRANTVLKNGKVEASFMGVVSVAPECTLDNMDIYGDVYAVSNNGGTMTVKSGKYIGGMSTAVQVEKGKVIIEDGYFYAPQEESDIQKNKNFTLNLMDGLLKNNAEAKPTDFLEVRGGRFVGFNPAISYTEPAPHSPCSFVAEGYESVQDGTETIDGVEYTVWKVQKKN